VRDECKTICDGDRSDQQVVRSYRRAQVSQVRPDSAVFLRTSIIEWCVKEAPHDARIGLARGARRKDPEYCPR
jgi:hypothetical protein